MKKLVSDLFRRLDRPASVLSAVFAGAFLETTVLPIPFEVLLVPLMLRHRRLLWMLVAAALAGCMAGAFAGYAVGAFAFDSFGEPLLRRLGAERAMDAFATRLESNGFRSVFLVGFTPVPVQVATLGAGFAGLPIVMFTLAMLVSRGLRYGALGVLVHVAGDRAQRLMREHRGAALAAGLVLVLVLAYLLFGPTGASSGVP